MNHQELPRIVRHVRNLVDELGLDGAEQAIRHAVASFSPVERAALISHWPLWARPKQLPPESAWKTWGFLCGRGFGKTLSVSKFVNAEVHAGRASLICVCAQDEDSAIAIQILGPSGLVATAPPLAKPHWEATSKRLTWPNGARAYVRTPEVPGKIRGLEYHLAWTTELQSWPVATRDEAFSNVRISTRLGYARIVWDATPKRRHPLLLELLEDQKIDPRRHVIVRGATHENAANLGDGYVDDLERKYGGTSRGREELLGEMLTESENALVRQAWIDEVRRERPAAFVYRALGVDPAVTARSGNDRTGIVDDALGVDGQVYCLGDFSGRHEPGAWAKIVLGRYVDEGIDVIIVETNKGGQLVTQNLRAAASSRNLSVVVVGRDEKPKHQSGVVYVKEVHARGPKEDRAQPVATAYELRRISHVRGVDLSSLEDVLTTWEPMPGQRSPDALDAHVHAVVELLGLSGNVTDATEGFRGLEQAARELGISTSGGGDIASLLRGGGGGRI